MNWNGIELPDKGIYFQDDDCIIYCADCREILSVMADKSIDLVLTDPPYGIALDLGWLSQMNLTAGKAKNKIDVPLIGDEGMDLSFLWRYPRRIVFGFPYIYDPQATGWLSWDKQPGIETDRTMTSPIEMASTTVWKGFRLVRCMWAGYLRDNGEYRFGHPTQKPQKVIAYAINKGSQLGQVILDPFLGSGTTTCCAKKLGRKCIGIEIEEKYCKIAVDRLRQSVMKL